MSSLLQFSGDTGKRGVQLEFVRTDETQSPWKDLDTYTCPNCGREHTLIGLSWRKPVDMFGPWVRFRFLGELHAPDLSVPISVPMWPVGTIVQSESESSRLWHRQ